MRWFNSRDWAVMRKGAEDRVRSMGRRATEGLESHEGSKQVLGEAREGLRQAKGRLDEATTAVRDTAREVEEKSK